MASTGLKGAPGSKDSKASIEKSARLWNRLAKRYAATPVRHQQDYRRKLELTRVCLGPDMEVFEYGCGTGSTALSHAPFVRRIHAIDYSSAMIDIARDKARVAGIDNVDFECRSIAAMDKADDSVDVVMAHSILHLVDDPRELIERSHAMLKPGGAFIVSSVCLAELAPVYKVAIALLRLIRIAPVLNRFSQSQLESWLADAGFGIEQLWRPGRDRAVFIVARKSGPGA